MKGAAPSSVCQGSGPVLRSKKMEIIPSSLGSIRATKGDENDVTHRSGTHQRKIGVAVAARGGEINSYPMVPTQVTAFSCPLSHPLVFGLQSCEMQELCLQRAGL